jgi:5'(3')-deoxyribonucleotidase
MKNIIIAVDCDDVCINLIDRWLYEYNSDFEDNLTRNDITDWDVQKFVKPECGTKIYRYIEDKTMYDYCQPVADSLEGVNLLRTMGRVIFVTHPTIGTAGRKYVWLKENGYIDSMEDYVEAKDKSLINFDFLIDDNYHNICRYKNSFLFNQPWNEKYFYAQRIKNWREYIDARKSK